MEVADGTIPLNGGADMAMSERNRAKGAARVQELLGGATPVHDYVVGHGHARLTTTAVVTLAVFGTAFLVALAFGQVLIPGVLVVWVGIRAVRPLLGVAVTHRGLAVVHVSMLNGRPSRVVVLLPPVPPWSDAATAPWTMALGPERVRFAKKEYARLTAAVAAVAPPAAQAAPINLR